MDTDQMWLPMTDEASTSESLGFGHIVAVDHEVLQQSAQAAANEWAKHERDTTAPLAGDNIQRPPHYARYAIEPISFIMLNELPYWAGNVVKYVCRAPFKHASEEEDIRKAIRYCEMRLEQLKRAREDDTAVVGNPL